MTECQYLLTWAYQSKALLRRDISLRMNLQSFATSINMSKHTYMCMHRHLQTCSKDSNSNRWLQRLIDLRYAEKPERKYAYFKSFLPPCFQESWRWSVLVTVAHVGSTVTCSNLILDFTDLLSASGGWVWFIFVTKSHFFLLQIESWSESLSGRNTFK